MYNLLNIVAFMSLILSLISLTRGALYVIQPSSGSMCHGGQPCTVQWLDNGELPLLSNVGPCRVGLYTGKQDLVQQIDPINVASAHSLQFTPDPNSGPNSDTYYISFMPTNANLSYLAFSPSFRIDQMKGSFNSPVASDTTSIPVPSSILDPPSVSVATTITIGAPRASSSPDPSATSNGSPRGSSTNDSSNTAIKPTSPATASVTTPAATLASNTSPGSSTVLSSTSASPSHSPSSNTAVRSATNLPLFGLGILLCTYVL